MTMARTAWLFTKDDDSVRLEIVETPEAIQLLIDGPGETTSRYDFPAGTAVESFRRDYEEKLVGDGYRLQVVSERRIDDAPSAQVTERRRRRPKAG